MGYDGIIGHTRQSRFNGVKIRGLQEPNAPSATEHHHLPRDGGADTQEPNMSSQQENKRSIWRALAAAGALWAVTGLGQAGAFELVSAAEAQQAALAEKTMPQPVRTRSLPKPDAPAIQVVTPNAPGTPVAAPLRIEVAFRPAQGAKIVPSSFRVLYGLLKIDLTDRLRPHATVTENGVIVEGAKVPDGQHRMFLQVADDKGNTAEQELRFRVGAAS